MPSEILLRGLRDLRHDREDDVGLLKDGIVEYLVTDREWHPVGDFDVVDTERDEDGVDRNLPNWFQPVVAVVRLANEIDADSAIIKFYAESSEIIKQG